MNDTWNPQGQDSIPDTQPVPETDPVTPAPEEPVVPTEEPAAPEAVPQPAQPSQPPVRETPAQPPYNGWSSDGSYRYVPPRTGNPPVQTPPVYRSPIYGANTPNVPNNGWQPTPQPTVPPQAPPVPPAQPPRPPRKKSNGWVVAVAIIAALGVIAAIVCLGFAMADEGLSDFSNGGNNGIVQPNESAGVVDAPSLEISDWEDDDGGLSTREVVNRNLDSTVVLTNYVESGSFQFGESSLVESGAASGIVMSQDGYIITNWHCVINEETGARYARIDVTTHDGTVYEDADIIGADESTDLAIIKINAKNLSVAEFGDSSALSVGDRVIALGNAAGLSWTATQGIVSALARDVYDDTGYAIKCLQTDAAINPGNSGGPLLNNQGLVVGINSSKIAANGYEGLGFSIPINEAKSVIDSLLKFGYVKGRVALGITGQTVSSGMYSGFLIASIGEGSSLEGTAAKAGDLIVAVDDVEVADYGELRSELAKHKVGDTVTLTLLRSESRTGRVSSFTVTVKLKEQTAQ